MLDHRQCEVEVAQQMPMRQGLVPNLIHDNGHQTHEIHLNLAFCIELKVTVSLEPSFDELPELGGEARVIQVMDTETRSGGFGRVSGSDTLLGGAN